MIVSINQIVEKLRDADTLPMFLSGKEQNVPMGIFADRLRSTRKKQRKTCMDISLGTDLNQNIIFQWEREKRSPNMKSLIKVADYLGVSIDYLTGRTENPNINK